MTSSPCTQHQERWDEADGCPYCALDGQLRLIGEMEKERIRNREKLSSVKYDAERLRGEIDKQKGFACEASNGLRSAMSLPERDPNGELGPLHDIMSSCTRVRGIVWFLKRGDSPAQHKALETLRSLGVEVDGESHVEQLCSEAVRLFQENAKCRDLADALIPKGLQEGGLIDG